MSRVSANFERIEPTNRQYTGCRATLSWSERSKVLQIYLGPDLHWTRLPPKEKQLAVGSYPPSSSVFVLPAMFPAPLLFACVQCVCTSPATRASSDGDIGPCSHGAGLRPRSAILVLVPLLAHAPCCAGLPQNGRGRNQLSLFEYLFSWCFALRPRHCE